MKHETSLIRLPWRFATAGLESALARLAGETWEGAGGIETLDLLTAVGAQRRIVPTEALRRSPALAALLAAPGVVLGPARLGRLPAGTESGLQHDLNPWWLDHGRLVYVLGDGVTIEVGQRRLEAPGGTVWLIDGWHGWNLMAAPDRPSLVLLADTVGSAAFWSMAAAADRPASGDEAPAMSPRTLQPERADDDAVDRLETERLPAPALRSAAELRHLAGIVVSEMRESGDGRPGALDRLEAATADFLNQWRAATARHGDVEAGRSACRQALEQLWPQFVQYAHPWRLTNGVTALERAHALLFADGLHDSRGRAIQVVPRQTLGQIIGRAGDAVAGKRGPAAAPPDAPAGEKADAEIADGADARGPQQPADDRERERTAPPDRGTGPASSRDAAAADARHPDPQAPLRSVHTRSFPELLREIGASVLVTTYQAGKLAVLRENEGVINTHFRVYNRPMGLAVDKGRLAVGTAWTVEEYRNMGEVAAKLDPPGRHDAAYLPRNIQITGNIDIHEMAYGREGLWIVNTRFSCLCTLDGEHSFVPRWRPAFISGYAPEDRCHLNGLELVDGKPRYVTALGSSDTAGGWRDNKAGGGVLIDVDSGDFVCRGLSMPHSPRWYDGKLWVLESGNGSLATVDPRTGQLDTVVELPGFTRGLDFYGPFAFIGLSQVRESAVFSGIRLTERVDERCCGVWVVDLRTARIVAFLKFEDAVQEVFAVSVLPGQRYPDVLGINDASVPVSYALPDDALAEVVRPAAAGEAAKE